MSDERTADIGELVERLEAVAHGSDRPYAASVASEAARALTALEAKCAELEKERGTTESEVTRWKTLYESAVKGRRDFRQAYREARLASQERAPVVKALEWKEERYGEFSAETEVGTYEVGFDDGWWAHLEDTVKWDWQPDQDPRSYEGPSAAKAAAQFDYERRILSAIKTSGRAPVVTEAMRGEIAYALTKRLVIDMPTARAAVDAALASSRGEGE